MTDIIAKRELLAKSPTGITLHTAIEFGKPYETEEHGWCCDLTMEGIDKPHYAAGIDSLQAIMLTMALAESILISRLKNGWQFFWPDTNEPMDIGGLFSLGSFVSIRNEHNK
jgi:hypothetical protein